MRPSAGTGSGVRALASEREQQIEQRLLLLLARGFAPGDGAARGRRGGIATTRAARHCAPVRSGRCCARSRRWTSRPALALAWYRASAATPARWCPPCPSRTAGRHRSRPRPKRWCPCRHGSMPRTSLRQRSTTTAISTSSGASARTGWPSAAAFARSFARAAWPA